MEKIRQAVMAGKIDVVKAEVQAALDAQSDAAEIINNGLIAGMNVVGSKMKTGEMFVPEVLMSARAMQAGLEMVKHLIAAGSITSAGKLVIGTVAGDLHDIGKNLVAMMFESLGFEVVDLGVNVTAQKFVEAVKEHQPQIVGLSALLTTTMPVMKETIDLLESEGIRAQVKVMIGGAPVSQEYANEIGANAYAADAAAAVDLAKQLVA